MGKNTIKALVAEREKNGAYTSLTDFCNRMESGELNKRSLESLIKAGALDSLGGVSKYIRWHCTIQKK